MSPDAVKYGTEEFEARAAESAAAKTKSATMAPAKKKSGCLMPLLSLAISMAIIALAVGAQLPKPVNLAPLPERCNTNMPIAGLVDREAYKTSTFTMNEGFSKTHDREFDLIVMGATGFTGKNVASYLGSQYDPSFKWAVAGRSEVKLKALVASFNPTFGVGVVVADSMDPASLASLAQRTRAVVTTAGPYSDYGSGLVAACAAAGTHYADLSGEPFWQRAMVDRHDATARATGAKIVVASGYDSIPFDLGALHAAHALGPGDPVASVSALVRESRGWLSGGTLQSALRTASAVMSGEVAAAAMADPYLLVPQDDAGVDQACRPDSDVSGWGVMPRWDADFGTLGVQHFMAPINARVVRRSLALRGHRNATYAEGISIGALADWFAFMVAKVLSGEMPVVDLVPKQGRGPSPAVMRDGRGAVDFVVRGASGRAVRTSVAYLGDPGYNATAKMLAEAGRCLALEACHQAPQALTVPGGGVTTASAAMGMGLIRRLKNADGGRFMRFLIV